MAADTEAVTAYERSEETVLVELGEGDDKEAIAHGLMAQTGHILPDGRFLIWQEINVLDNRTIEAQRSFVKIPQGFRGFFTVMRSCRLSMDPML